MSRRPDRSPTQAAPRRGVTPNVARRMTHPAVGPVVGLDLSAHLVPHEVLHGRNPVHRQSTVRTPAQPATDIADGNASAALCPHLKCCSFLVTTARAGRPRLGVGMCRLASVAMQVPPVARSRDGPSELGSRSRSHRAVVSSPSMLRPPPPPVSPSPRRRHVDAPARTLVSSRCSCCASAAAPARHAPPRAPRRPPPRAFAIRTPSSFSITAFPKFLVFGTSAQNAWSLSAKERVCVASPKVVAGQQTG